MKSIFWISWIIDFAVAIWWCISEWQLQYLKTNPFAVFYLGYVLVILFLFLKTSFKKTSLALSLIPAIPLLFLALIALIMILSGERWN